MSALWEGVRTVSISVVTYNAIEGFHFWPGAPPECSYLSHRHRHVFVIRCEFHVTDADREIEIALQQHEIQNSIAEKFKAPAEFREFSCEQIAQWVLEAFPACVKCEVLEDGMGGAIVRR
jgi:hypothetical protein